MRSHNNFCPAKQALANIRSWTNMSCRFILCCNFSPILSILRLKEFLEVRIWNCNIRSSAHNAVEGLNISTTLASSCIKITRRRNFTTLLHMQTLREQLPENKIAFTPTGSKQTGTIQLVRYFCLQASIFNTLFTECWIVVMLYSMMCDLVISFFGKKKKKKEKKRRLLRVSSFSLPPLKRVCSCACALKKRRNNFSSWVLIVNQWWRLMEVSMLSCGEIKSFA